MDRIIKGVYQIKCVTNGQVYIGSSFNIEKRIRSHFKDLKNKTHANYKLQTDYCRLGRGVFEITTLEEYSGTLRNPLYDLEQKWFNCTDNKYNILTDAKAHLDKTPALPKPVKVVKPTGRKKKLAKNKWLYSSSAGKNLTSRKFQETEPLQRRIRRKTKDGDVQEWKGNTLTVSPFQVKPKKAKAKNSNYTRLPTSL